MSSTTQLPAGFPATPPAAPSPSDMADADRFQAAVDSSVDHVRASAEKWRSGTASLVTLVTTALLLQGPQRAGELTTGWRVALTVLLGLGLAAVLVSLWSALEAAAGTPQISHLPVIVEEYGSVRTYEVVQADRAVDRLKRARRFAVPGLLLLATGALAWLWADTTDPSPSVLVTHGEQTTCGSIDSASDQTLVLDVADRSSPVTIPFADVDDLVTAADC